MKTKDYKTLIGKETLACSLDYVDVSQKPTIIFLHGAGPSNKEQVKYLSDLFTLNNQNVIRFDFSGHGDSSGLLKESSLIKRQNEALGIIEHFNMDINNLTVIGTSMGGYIATSLAKVFNIKNLILFCPAAYDIKAWDVPFDERFTSILRRDLSLLKSNIKELLANFHGRSLIFLAEKDEIIQPIIVEMYQSILNKEHNFTHTISDCPHPIHRWVAEKETKKDEIKEEIRKFMSFA